MEMNDMTLDIVQEIEIKASPEEVFKAVLFRLGDGNVTPEGESLHMLLEAWPGGRWFRDRGNGIGHFWGHVQSIKPNELLELSGPMFMSYPAVNHVEAKLKATSAGTLLTFRHRAFGLLDPRHKEGVKSGWNNFLQLVEADSTRASAIHA